ncbi:MAG: hypothetical protein MIO92_07130 [Methanosarcinaceae archaeon]|nr:hypothetical protein [Methanosarcinaceae archaeon]
MPSNTSKSNLRIFLIFLLGIMIVLVITGCDALTGRTPLPPPTELGQTETPPTPLPTECKPIRFANSSGMSLLTFPDGSQMFLGNNTEIDFIPADYCPGFTEHRAYLLHGEIAVRSLLPDDSLFTVFSPEGFKVTLDDTGLVSYNLENKLLTLNCSNGKCTIGTEQQPYLLICGQMVEFDQNAVLNGPFGINVSVLAPYGDWLLPNCNFIPDEPTSTPTPTSDVGATATAACSAWNNEFPMTPCPTFSNP